MAHGIQDKPMALWKQELNIATFGCSIVHTFQFSNNQEVEYA